MKKLTKLPECAGLAPERRYRVETRGGSRLFLACSVLLALTAVVHAGTVAEWKFDGKEPLGADQIVPLENFAPSASGESVLMAASSFSPETTGLADKWAPFLRTGFLDANAGEGKGAANQHGLVTKNTRDEKMYPAGNASYRAYLGFAGLGGNGKGGTVYLVVSPKTWTSGSYSLFGTGHFGGQVFLSVGKGDLRLVTGQGGSGTMRTQASVSQEWQTDSWYFIAISWSGGQEPVLYVRKMEAAGPEASPTAVIGTTTGPVPEISEQPHFDPLVIGARWVNTGGADSLFTMGGANARFAYARVDNQYSSKEDMEAVFLGLGAP